MSNTQLMLAYVLKQRESENRTALRIAGCENHLNGLFKGGLNRTLVGDGGSGVLAWTSPRDPVNWSPNIAGNEEGTFWLHIPSNAGGPEFDGMELKIADDLFSGRTTPENLGAPFAVTRWRRGHLEIMNDVLGLVRLFHFEFPDGDVWSTRAGLAHVFMAAQVQKNRKAWRGMATIGWAPSGSTQMGDGRQLPAYTKVSAGWGLEGRYRSSESSSSTWHSKVLGADIAGPELAVRDMGNVMATAMRWPTRAVADLSGGKDSRVVAAVAITNGAVNRLRTRRTDHGEVETAQRLVALLEQPVFHDIVEQRDPSEPDGYFLKRLSSQHAAWEGRFLASSGYNSRHFEGFGQQDAPRLNGLGGESMAGGNLLGAWRERLKDAPAAKARDRLAAMARLGLGSSDNAKEATAETLGETVSFAESLGYRSANAVMDVFYSYDKMPNWSIVYATRNTLTPLFAASLLGHAVSRMGAPVHSGMAHTSLLEKVLPQWATVPFYSPSAARHAAPRVWQHSDWPSIRDYVNSHLDAFDSFDPAKASAVLSQIDAGSAARSEEIFVHRFLWEASFDEHIMTVRMEAKFVADRLREWDMAHRKADL